MSVRACLPSSLAAALLLLVLSAPWLGEALQTIATDSESSLQGQTATKVDGVHDGLVADVARHASQTPAQELYSTQSLARHGVPLHAAVQQGACHNFARQHGPPGTCNAVSVSATGLQPVLQPVSDDQPAAPTTAGHAANAASTAQQQQQEQQELHLEQQQEQQQRLVPPPLPPPLPQQPIAAAPVQQQQQQQQQQQAPAYAGAPPPPRRLLNLAALSDGAAVVAVNPEARKPERTLDQDEDSFMKNDCSAYKWIMVELSQLGTVQSIRLTNKELYSSRVRHFRVRGRQAHPRRDGPDLTASLASDLWEPLGDFTAENRRGTQTFELAARKRVRYVLFEFISHYGTESMCALNSIEVLGVSAAQELEEALGGLDEEELAVPAAVAAAAAAVAASSGGAVDAAGGHGEGQEKDAEQQARPHVHQQQQIKQHMQQQQQQALGQQQLPAQEQAANKQHHSHTHSVGLDPAAVTPSPQHAQPMIDAAPEQQAEGHGAQLKPGAAAAAAGGLLSESTSITGDTGAETAPQAAGTASLAQPNLQPVAPAEGTEPTGAACRAGSANGCADNVVGGLAGIQEAIAAAQQEVVPAEAPAGSMTQPTPPPQQQQKQHEQPASGSAPQQPPSSGNGDKHRPAPDASRQQGSVHENNCVGEQLNGACNQSEAALPLPAATPVGGLQGGAGQPVAVQDQPTTRQHQQPPEQQQPQQGPIAASSTSGMPSPAVEQPPQERQRPQPPLPPAAATPTPEQQLLSMLDGAVSGKPKQAGNLFDIIKSEMVQLKVEQSKTARRLEALGRRNEELEAVAASLQRHNEQLQGAVRALESGLGEAVRLQLRELLLQQGSSSTGTSSSANFGAAGPHVNAAGGGAANAGASSQLASCRLQEHVRSQQAAVALGFGVAASLCAGLVLLPKGAGRHGVRVLVAVSVLVNGVLAALLAWRALLPAPEPLVVPVVPRHRMLSNASWGDAAG